MVITCLPAYHFGNLWWKTWFQHSGLIMDPLVTFCLLLLCFISCCSTLSYTCWYIVLDHEIIWGGDQHVYKSTDNMMTFNRLHWLSNCHNYGANLLRWHNTNVFNSACKLILCMSMSVVRLQCMMWEVNFHSPKSFLVMLTNDVLA